MERLCVCVCVIAKRIAVEKQGHTAIANEMFYSEIHSISILTVKLMVSD